VIRVLGVAAAVIALANIARAQDSSVPVGSRAPSAVVQSLDGKDVDLSTYIGKGPVLLEFWATWCPNCHELEPQLLSLVKQYAGTVTFIGVAVSINESATRVEAYAKKHGFTHPIFYDTHGTASGAYDVPATSWVVVIDKTGKIVYEGVGGDQDLGAAVKKAL